MSQEYKITETLQKYYDKVFQDGKLINIHIGMWGMSYNLTEEDIKLDNKLPETIKLGKKMLIKPAVYNKFKSFEQRVRKYLYVNSFDFPLVSQAHFVPKAKYLDVYKKLDEMREEYVLMVAEFVEKYEDYKKEVLEYYQDHKDTVSVEDLEAYYPSLANIKKKFYFDIVSFEIALPAQFGELNLQDEIHRETVNNEAKQTAMDNYKAEYNKQIELHTSKLSSFMEEVTAAVRSKVAEHFSVVLSKVNKKEVVSPASIQTLYKQIEEFRTANIADDKFIEAELNKLEKLLDGKPNFRDDRDAIGLLKQHLGNVVKAAEDVTDVANVSGEYFRKLSI
jgi:hypothetical protein